jgi:ubiquinol-cytochrome c reductase cytochrome b/c1 subunit
MFLLKDDTTKFPVSTIKLYQVFGLLLLTLFILQLVTGILLSAIFVYSLEHSFDTLAAFVSNNFYLWLIRDLHMLGANIALALLYIHIGKGFSLRNFTLTKLAIYTAGTTIFLLALGSCFTGYVLVTGQMSYWALLVILNLVTVIPGLDTHILDSLLAGSHTTTWTLRRFFTLHWLIALLCLLSVLLHVLLLHRDTPSSDPSISTPTSTLLDVLSKDGTLSAPILLCSLLSLTRTLIHPDNWSSHDPLKTPAHIEPEPYFLWLFCILKSRPSKLVGVISLVILAIIQS